MRGTRTRTRRMMSVNEGSVCKGGASTDPSGGGTGIASRGKCPRGATFATHYKLFNSKPAILDFNTFATHYKLLN